LSSTRRSSDTPSETSSEAFDDDDDDVVVSSAGKLRVSSASEAATRRAARALETRRRGLGARLEGASVRSDEDIARGGTSTPRLRMFGFSGTVRGEPPATAATRRAPSGATRVRRAPLGVARGDRFTTVDIPVSTRVVTEQTIRTLLLMDKPPSARFRE
jgi:hypothetical protein